MTNQTIADTLVQLADLLEFTGTNPFRLRAYRNAARKIAGMTESIADLVAAGEVGEVVALHPMDTVAVRFPGHISDPPRSAGSGGCR